MARNIVKSFNTIGNDSQIFEVIKNYLPALKFNIQTAQKPALIVAKRGSAFGSMTSFHIEKALTILTISISRLQSGTQIVCDYDIKTYGGIMLPRDKDFIENEIEVFKNYLINQFQKENKNFDEKNDTNTQSKPKYIIELEHLAKLRDDGIISQDDFDVKKRQLLDIK